MEKIRILWKKKKVKQVWKNDKKLIDIGYGTEILVLEVICFSCVLNVALKFLIANRKKISYSVSSNL